MSEYNYNPDYDIFDPRRRPESSSGRAADDGEYRPRHPRKGLSPSGEYRPRHTLETESSKKSSPSPVEEGGDGDFDVFNFDAARRRKLEREERLNAQLAAAEHPRELVGRMAENQPRRPAATQTRKTPGQDQHTKKAADFVSRLSGYTQPLHDEAERRRSGSGQSTRQGRSSGGNGSSNNRSAGKKENSKQRKSGWFASLSKPKKTVVVAGAAVLALVLMYYAAFGVLLSGMGSLELKRRENTAAAEVSELSLMSSSGVTNILLLGIDDDGSDGSRSDTMMIASLDNRGNTIRLCSILRDCYVSIPGYKNNRVNAAYAYGGAQLAVQTVESNFRVKIDHCVTIDMAALVEVVDAMGGVEIELTSAEANQVNLHSHCGLTTEAGLQLLNGKQAVTYAQIRKIDSDFMRTQRQRTLINAILSKMRSLGVGELMNVVQAVAPNVATDMSSTQIASLALKALPALTNELGQMTIPSDGYYRNATINGMSVLDLNIEANAKLLQSYLYSSEK